MSIFDRSDETPAEKARHEVRYTVERMIKRLAVDGYEARSTQAPIGGYRSITKTVLDPATAGIRAARQIERTAHGQVHEHAMAARGAGCSWREIGEAVGLTDEDDDDIAVAVYRYLIWDSPLDNPTPDYLRRDQKAWWTCESCEQRVTDVGPWGGHPDDNETGHAATCERHNDAVRAYMADWDDD